MYLMQNPDVTEVVNPDDIRIKRVYVRETGQLAPDETVRQGQPIDIVVEWQAGSAANAYYNSGGGPPQVQLEIIIYDLYNVVNIPMPVGSSPVLLNTDGETRLGTYQTEFKLPAIHFPAVNPYEIVAILVGPAPPAGQAFQAAFGKCLFYVY